MWASLTFVVCRLWGGGWVGEKAVAAAGEINLFLDKVEVRSSLCLGYRGCMNDVYCVPKILYFLCVI